MPIGKAIVRICFTGEIDEILGESKPHHPWASSRIYLSAALRGGPVYATLDWPGPTGRFG